METKSGIITQEMQGKVQEATQQAQAGDPFHGITNSAVEDASSEEMVLDCDADNSDQELDHDYVDI